MYWSVCSVFWASSLFHFLLKEWYLLVKTANERLSTPKEKCFVLFSVPFVNNFNDDVKAVHLEQCTLRGECTTDFFFNSVKPLNNVNAPFL